MWKLCDLVTVFVEIGSWEFPTELITPNTTYSSRKTFAREIRSFFTMVLRSRDEKLYHTFKRRMMSTLSFQ